MARLAEHPDADQKVRPCGSQTGLWWRARAAFDAFTKGAPKYLGESDSVGCYAFLDPKPGTMGEMYRDAGTWDFHPFQKGKSRACVTNP